ncbi:MAG: hemin ABC transporter ATP-binding protein, partial [Lacticaseibacillus paracasei]|nr:hemin ABC transporter ATP-binding protein [Lacticaseibacillus paracasei]
MAILIQLKQVSKIYGTGHTAVTALYPTDLTLKA